MPKFIEGKLDATGLKCAIIVGRFNSFISERLLEGAVDALVRHGASDGDITVARVPGAFEIPLAAQKLAHKNGGAIKLCSLSSRLLGIFEMAGFDRVFRIRAIMLDSRETLFLSGRNEFPVA